VPRVSIGWKLLLGASLLAIMALTLRPSSASVGSLPSTCVLCGERGLVDLVLNVVLFLPIGVALSRFGVRPLQAVGMALVLSGIIELLQHVIPGRAPTWRDVVMNGIGAGLGALVARDLRDWLRAGRSNAWVTAAAALPALATVLTGLLLAPSVKTGQWYGQLAPRLAHLGVWEGIVRSARIGDQTLVHGFLADGPAVQAAMRDRAPVLIEAIAGPRTTRLAPIIAISDDEFEEMMLIGQDGDDLIVRERRVASDLRLFEPETRFVGWFATLGDGAPFSLRVRFGRSTACVAQAGTPERCAERFAAASGWTFLLWRRWLGGPWRAALGAVTLAILFVPLGLLLSPRSAVWRVAYVATAVTGVVLAARAVSLAAPTVWEWGAMLAGIAGGVALRHVTLAGAASERSSPG